MDQDLQSGMMMKVVLERESWREEGERERDRKKEKKERNDDTGTQTLMEQRYFNYFSVVYIGCEARNFFIDTKIRKPNVQQLLPWNKGLIMVTKGQETNDDLPRSGIETKK